MQELIKNKKIKSLLLISLSIILIFVSLYKVYTFSEALTFDYEILNISDYNSNSFVFTNLILWVGSTFVLCILTMIYLLKESSANIIYVEKKELTEVKKEGEKNQNVNEGLEINLEKILKNKGGDINNEDILSDIAHSIQAVQAILYLKKKTKFQLEVGFAVYDFDQKPKSFNEGQGLNGKAASERKPLTITNIESNFKKAGSGLGKATPNSLIILPLISNDVVIGVVEFALFKPLGEINENKLFDFCTYIDLLKHRF